MIRTWRRFLTVAHLNVLTIFCSTTCALALTIPTVPVGNPGNPADSNGNGSVPHAFNVSVTEITNAQYVEFLNAVAATDTYGLWVGDMATKTTGGIVRSGTPGSYTYSVKPDAAGAGPGGTDYSYGNKPVNWVNYYDNLRFANWLHNGQPTGAQDASTTEDGAYTFTGPTTVGGRNPGAKWFLTNTNEWYKAAYYDGTAGVYYDYPTGTDTPTNAALPSADTGNEANFLSLLSTSYPFTDVGAYTLSSSPYGTYDQGGNASERVEEIPGLRGGSTDSGSASLLSSLGLGSGISPTIEAINIGFRVGSIPEPGAILLSVLAAIGLVLRRAV